MTEIHTPRLFLRYLRPEDASDVYVGWLNDPEVNRYLETRHTEQTLESCKVFIQQCEMDPGSHLFGIFLGDSGTHIGNAKIGMINTTYKRGQVSLFIGEKHYWGQGFSSELVGALTQFGFDTLGLHRLEAGCYEDNLASLRVFLKNGYAVEGFFREHVISDDQHKGCFWLGKLKSDHNAPS